LKGRDRSRKFLKGRGRSRKFWKAGVGSRIFYLRLCNPAVDWRCHSLTFLWPGPTHTHHYKPITQPVPVIPT